MFMCHIYECLSLSLSVYIWLLQLLSLLSWYCSPPSIHQCLDVRNIFDWVHSCNCCCHIVLYVCLLFVCGMQQHVNDSSNITILFNISLILNQIVTLNIHLNTHTLTQSYIWICKYIACNIHMQTINVLLC